MGATSSQVQDDIDLVRTLKDPQQRAKAFEEVIRRHQEPLYWHIRKMVKGHSDTDDLLQVTFIKAWKSIENFRGDSKLKTWLYRIATNECLTFLNREKKRSFSDVADLEDNLAHSHHSTDTLTGEDIQAKLRAAIATLPEKQRLVFNMKYFEELKYQEIQEILGGTVGSLKASFHHAVKKVESFLRGD